MKIFTEEGHELRLICPKCGGKLTHATILNITGGELGEEQIWCPVCFETRVRLMPGWDDDERPALEVEK